MQQDKIKTWKEKCFQFSVFFLSLVFARPCWGGVPCVMALSLEVCDGWIKLHSWQKSILNKPCGFLGFFSLFFFLFPSLFFSSFLFLIFWRGAKCVRTSRKFQTKLMEKKLIKLGRCQCKIVLMKMRISVPLDPLFSFSGCVCFFLFLNFFFFFFFTFSHVCQWRPLCGAVHRHCACTTPYWNRSLPQVRIFPKFCPVSQQVRFWQLPSPS